jgi:hypothetical protein
LRSEGVGISNDEVAIWKNVFVELWALLKSIDASIFQRSRARWVKEGYANSRYFHACINARKRSNNIFALRTSHGWVEGPAGVREAVVLFFKQHFDNDDGNMPVLEGVVFPFVSDVDNLFLEATFSREEIDGVVQSIEGSKCPRPDGFNFSFIKEFWWLMKNDFRILFDQFRANECIPHSLMSYFLTLIPKTKSPKCLGDSRPISLLGCIYNLLAKVLAARLAMVIGPLIPKTQTAFLKGRQLLEGWWSLTR